MAAPTQHSRSKALTFKTTSAHSSHLKHRHATMMAPQLLAALASVLLASQQVAASCNNWSTRYQTNLKGVCVCNELECDTVSNNYTSLMTGQVGVYTTSKAGDRFAYKVVSVDSTAVSSPTYSIDVSTQYQTMIGFGGSFTDAAAINVYKLSSTLQQMVLDQYFSETGLQYSLGRVPIGSTDFSTSIYSYNDVVDDFEMEHFSIAVDKSPSSHKIDLIQRALNTSSRNVTMFATSWAPPTWMTTENTTLNCALKGNPGEKYWKALALYYSKFFDAYSQEGINFGAMTVQNEPSKSILQTVAWQSLRFSAEKERDFVKLDLGPRMAKDHPGLKIIAGDDQKSGILDRLAPFEDADALKYISGLGVHWYRDLDFFFFGIGGDLTNCRPSTRSTRTFLSSQRRLARGSCLAGWAPGLEYLLRTPTRAGRVLRTTATTSSKISTTLLRAMLTGTWSSTRRVVRPG